MNENISETIHADEELNSMAKEYLCDVVFYDEHGDCLKRTVKPGDIMLLINVHYYVRKNCSVLALHEGGERYNRGIRILDHSSSQKAELLNAVKAFVANRTFSMQGVYDASFTSEVAVILEESTKICG
uniref:POT1PC domain-containing protein n=1 Tax=Loa loa TaxID=7209 RepID=A0A1I7VVI4_LOALO